MTTTMFFFTDKVQRVSRAVQLASATSTSYIRQCLRDDGMIITIIMIDDCYNAVDTCAHIVTCIGCVAVRMLDNNKIEFIDIKQRMFI